MITKIEKVQKTLQIGIIPFSELECLHNIVNICAGQVSSHKFNIDQCIAIHNNQVKSFYESLPNGFCEPLLKKVVPMAAGKDSVKVGDVNVLDNTLIYSRVMALQMTNTIIEADVLFSYELAPQHSCSMNLLKYVLTNEEQSFRKLLVQEVSA